MTLFLTRDLTRNLPHLQLEDINGLNFNMSNNVSYYFFKYFEQNKEQPMTQIYLK